MDLIYITIIVAALLSWHVAGAIVNDIRSSIEERKNKKKW